MDSIDKRTKSRFAQTDGGGRRSPFSLWLAVVIGLLAGVYLTPRLEYWFNPADAEPRPVTTRGDLADDEQSTIELFRAASPSVVYITTLTREVNPWTRHARDVPSGTGSGFVWDHQGHIVTNFHVIQNANGASVTLSDHVSYSAVLVGVSPEFDLAVLKINAPPGKLRPIPVGTSRDLQVGQKVFAIGNPFGLDQTLTTGVASALNRSIEGVGGRPIEGVVQTDAAINPGNSGGPLLDSAGRLIGVNTAIFSPSGAYAGIGFAVPVDTVNRIAPRLITQGRYARPQLGVLTEDDISNEFTEQVGVQGLMILGVRPDSPAAKAGLRGALRTASGELIPGDIIQVVAGQPVRSTNDLLNILDRHEVGDTITLTIWRERRSSQVEVRLE